MIYQTDKRLRLEARDNECYVFCILDIFEELTGHILTIEEIDNIHKILVKVGYIRMDGYVKEYGIQGIAQVASGVTGEHCYIKLVSEMQEYNFLVAYFTRVEGTRTLGHFVRMFLDNKHVVKYDPWDKNGSKTVREGKLESYRYIYGIKL